MWNVIWHTGSCENQNLSQTETMQSVSGEVGLDEDNVKLVAENLEKTHQVIIANIDQDGFFLSRFMGRRTGFPALVRKNFYRESGYPWILLRSTDLLVSGKIIGTR